MKRAVPPAVADPGRLQAVRATGLLDTLPEEAFDRLATLASTVLAAPYAFVTLVDDSRSFWKARIGPGLEASQNPVEESFCQYVVGSGERLIVGDTEADERTSDNPSIESMGVKAWAGYPVHAPTGEVLGTLCVVDLVTREWSDQDVSVLETLSQAVSSEIALRSAAARAETHAAQLSDIADRASALAQTLQESLLPPHLPVLPDAEIAACYLPAGTGEVLGDFYDAFATGDATWAMVLGDVSGKGVPAAKVAALARYTLRAAAVHNREPCKALSELNAALMTQRPHGDDGFVTAVFVGLEPGAGGMAATLCSGGHMPTLIRRRDGGVEEVAGHGRILGMFDDAALEDVQVELQADDLLLLYSDGVTEARSPEGFFGHQRLRVLLASTQDLSAEATVTAIERAVVEFAPGKRTDDIALLAIRIRPSGGSAVGS